MISELLAVWDHQPARAYGGTADVVAHARDQGRFRYSVTPSEGVTLVLSSRGTRGPGYAPTPSFRGFVRVRDE
jgi:hypothetical protein